MNVQPVVHYKANQWRDCVAEREVSRAMYALRAWVKKQLGVTFTLKRQAVHRFSRDQLHWTDMLREYAGGRLCDNTTVFASFTVGEPWQGGVYGAGVWGCPFSVPGRIGGYWWTQTDPTGLRGWLSHELGHAIAGLRHPLPPDRYAAWMLEHEGVTVPEGAIDPRSIGANVMGGGYRNWPDTSFHDMDVPLMLEALA